MERGRRTAPAPTIVARGDTVIIVSLALAPAIGLGIARFAYALVLPAMRADLGWSYADAGWMNTTNAAGYLVGALFASRAIGAFGAYRIMVTGVWACIVALLLCALFRHAVPLNAARILAGLGGGFAFVSGGVLATGVAQRNPANATFLLSLFYGGAGFGILLSGLAVVLVLEHVEPGAWNAAWAALTVISFPMAIGLHLARGENTAVATIRQERPRYRALGWLLCGYLLFGAGYIAYMTFMIAYVQSSGQGPAFQALFWTIIGIATMASPWLWTIVLKRFLHGFAFAALTCVTAVGAVLPLLSDHVLMLLVSAALFGSAFFAVVASTTAFVRRNLAHDQWASGIGMLTAMFGVGQMLGPVAIGFVNDRLHNLSGGLWTSVSLLLIAMAFGALQRDRR